MKKVLATILLFGLAACNPASSPAAADHHIGDTIRAAEVTVNHALAAKDAAIAASYYAPDAQMFNPGAPPATTPAAILDSYHQLMNDPNGSLAFQSSEVVIPSSGDYAVSHGTFTVSYTDPASHQKVTQTGDYMTLWRHQDDGSWKIMRDMASPGAAPPPAGSK